MRRLVIVSLALLAVLALLAPGRAGAEPIAVAVNTPFGWHWSLGASAWVGLDEHHALRANVARYRGPLLEIIPNLLEADGDDDFDEKPRVPPDFGATTDLGLGWVYCPRRVLDGASLEVGALLRINRLRSFVDENNVADYEHFTNVYSVRVLAGWTWRLSDWWFIAAGLGGSAGYERGRQKSFVAYNPDTQMDITTEKRVSRLDVSVEAYLRVGLAFGQ